MMNEDEFYSSGQVGYLQILCERFDHRNNQYAELISKEYIGIVNLYEQTMRRMVQNLKYPVVWVGSDKMKWATDEKLETLKLMIRPKVKNKDALAAMRHLVGYICNYTGTDPHITKCRTQMLATLKGLWLWLTQIVSMATQPTVWRPMTARFSLYRGAFVSVFPVIAMAGHINRPVES